MLMAESEERLHGNIWKLYGSVKLNTMKIKSNGCLFQTRYYRGERQFCNFCENMTITQCCAQTARNGFVSDLVLWKHVLFIFIKEALWKYCTESTLSTVVVNTQPFCSSLDFVWDNLGKPVPKEKFTHSHLSWSLLQPFYVPLDFVQSYPGEPVPDR